MNTQAYYRKQTALLSEIKSKLRINPSKPRWSDTQIYLAINEGIRTWHDLVRTHQWYSLPDGFSYGIFEYAVPTYIRSPVRIQIRVPRPYTAWGVESGTYRWNDIGGTLELDGQGGQVVVVHAPPRALEGRVGFYAPNSVVPYSSPLPKLSGGISASATSLVLNGAYETGDTGHIQIEGEIITYLGVSRGASTTTLQNLQRGVGGTTAATHANDVTVEWCVAVDDPALYNQLFDYAAYALHRMFQVDGGTHEREAHQQMMLFHKQNADAFWQGYAPQRGKPRMVLGRRKFLS